jgi:hypothetical protein
MPCFMSQHRRIQGEAIPSVSIIDIMCALALRMRQDTSAIVIEECLSIAHAMSILDSFVCCDNDFSGSPQNRRWVELSA